MPVPVLLLVLGKKIQKTWKTILHSIKFECKIWAVIESGVVWEGYNIKLRTICLKAQNCFQVLTGGHVRGNTKT